MNKILEWQPEKSRFRASAKIENVHRIREDLASLAEWIQTKADAGELTAKADLVRIEHVEKVLAEIRDELRAAAGRTQDAVQECRRQAERLSQASTAVEAVLGECRKVYENLQHAEGALRDFAAHKLTAAAEHVASVTRIAEEAKATAGEISKHRDACVDLNRSMRSAIEENQRRISELVSQVETSVAAARVTAGDIAATQAKAGELKAGCDELMKTLQLKSEEWIASPRAIDSLTGAPERKAGSSVTNFEGETRQPDPRLAAIEAELRSMNESDQERFRTSDEETARFRRSAKTFFGRVNWLLFGDRSD